MTPLAIARGAPLALAALAAAFVLAALLAKTVHAIGRAADAGPAAAAAATRPRPASVPARGPVRVKTWYYFGLNGVNANVPPGLMARYAEFAEDGEDVEHAAAFKRAGGKYAVAYTDPAYVAYCFPPFGGTRNDCRGQVGRLIHDDRAWFHGPDGTRVRRFVSEHFGYQQAIDPLSPAARAAWRETTLAIVRKGPIDLFLADDSGGPLHARDMSPKSSEFYGFNEAGVEITSDAVFRDAWIAYLANAARPLIVNGYDPTDGKPSYGGAFLRRPFVWGAEHEGCFRRGEVPVTTGAAWLQQENGLLATTALRKYAICFVLGAPVPATRVYALASWWLTYDPRWSVFAPTDPVPRQSALLPELAIVPGYPVRTPVANVTELRSPLGAYAREFSGCYQNGRLIGGCAAVVNPDAAFEVAMPPLSGRYSRSLVLDRDDLLHGGRASWAAGVPARISAASAVILAR